MASNKETSSFFKMMMFVLILISVIITFMLFTPNKVEKHGRVAKPVTTAEVVEKTEVANRVVRDLGDTSENSPVVMKLDLCGLSLDLKNSK